MPRIVGCSRSEPTSGRPSVHVARRLADEVEAHLPGWLVDVDHDRWHGANLRGLKKRMRAAIPESSLADALPELGDDGHEGESKDVYQDIIADDRACLGAEHNLLVVR